MAYPRLRDRCLGVMDAHRSAAALFRATPAGLVATDACLSPWRADALHGGPVAMLLASAIEGVTWHTPGSIARLTVEFLRVVRPGPLTVWANASRSGHRVQFLEAQLLEDGSPVARASAVRIRDASVGVPPVGGARAWPSPSSLPAQTEGYRSGGGAFHRDGVEVRANRALGGDAGPGWAWFRLKLPLLPDEPTSALGRACAIADFASGISNEVHPERMTYINADLTVHVFRDPVGEWILVDASTALGRRGIGVATSSLYDSSGRFGATTQSLLLDAAHPS